MLCTAVWIYLCTWSLNRTQSKWFLICKLFLLAVIYNDSWEDFFFYEIRFLLCKNKLACYKVVFWGFLLWGCLCCWEFSQVPDVSFKNKSLRDQFCGAGKYQQWILGFRLFMFIAFTLTSNPKTYGDLKRTRRSSQMLVHKTWQCHCHPWLYGNPHPQCLLPQWHVACGMPFSSQSLWPLPLLQLASTTMPIRSDSNACIY